MLLQIADHADDLASSCTRPRVYFAPSSADNPERCGRFTAVDLFGPVGTNTHSDDAIYLLAESSFGPTSERFAMPALAVLIR
jgi:hypothetical protein